MSDDKAKGHQQLAPSHAGGEEASIGHVVSLKMLLGVFGALMVLTVLTVSATAIDLGPSMNLIVAMGIASVKAALVMAIFMHLWWDKKYHLLVFLTSVLFAALFIMLALQDRREYQPDVDAFQADEAAAAAK